MLIAKTRTGLVDLDRRLDMIMIKHQPFIRCLTVDHIHLGELGLSKGARSAFLSLRDPLDDVAELQIFCILSEFLSSQVNCFS